MFNYITNIMQFPDQQVYGYIAIGSSTDGVIRRPDAFDFHYQYPSFTDINIQPEFMACKCPFFCEENNHPRS